MKLRPITRADLHAASALLTEGFPVHSRQYWDTCVLQMLTYAEQRWDGVIGHFAASGGHDIGLCLAIPSMRVAYEAEPRKVVNLAALYMRPGNEWMTTLFMRRLMKDPDVEYLDVTASQSMRKVLRQLGFADRSTGMVIVPTPLAAARPGTAVRVLPEQDITPDMMSPAHRQLLDQHARLEAMSLGLEVDGAVHPLILVPSSRKRLASGRIILARDRELIGAAAGALSRHLLKRGIFFFEFDSPSPVRIIGARFARAGAPVQTTWPVESAAIDHTFSELLFIPSPRRRRLIAWGRRGAGSALPFTPGLLDISFTATPSASLVLSFADRLPL